MSARVLLIKAAPKADRPSLAPPVGIISLAAALRRAIDAEVRLFDAGFDMYGKAPVPDARLQELVRTFRPQVVGISALTCERDALDQLAKAVRRVEPDVPIVVGGPYPTSEPVAWRSATDVDWAFRGEAEDHFPEVVTRLVGGRSPLGVPGVVGRSGDAGPVAPPVADLEGLPLGAWDLVDLRSYSQSKYRNMTGLPAFRVYAGVCTSRGCPYRCSYCHDVHGKRFRAWSPERVLREIDHVASFGAREIHFVDDIFNFDLERSKQIFRAMATRRPRFSIAFPNGLRADRLDREFVKEAKAAGARCASVAVETASPRLQKLIRKHLDLDRVREAIAWFEEEGIRTRAFVMLGFPTETVEEMEASIRYVIESRTSEASFFNVVPYRGSHLHDLAEGFAPGAADEVALAPFYSEQSFYAKATGRDLLKIRDRAILRFYLSRLRFIRVFLSMPLRFYVSRGFLSTVFYFGLRAVRSVFPKRSAVCSP